MEIDKTIIHKLQLAVRLVDGDTLLPVQRAMVVLSSTKQRALEKPGGYYIFTQCPAAEESLRIVHQNYKDKQAVMGQNSAMTVYLSKKRSKNAEPLQLICSRDARAGDSVVPVNIVNRSESIILDDCILVAGSESYRIRNYDRLSGSLFLYMPLKTAVGIGIGLTVEVQS